MVATILPHKFSKELSGPSEQAAQKNLYRTSFLNGRPELIDVLLDPGHVAFPTLQSRPGKRVIHTLQKS